MKLESGKQLKESASESGIPLKLEIQNPSSTYNDCRGGSRGRVQGVRPPPEMTCGFLIQLVFKKTMWFIGVEVEQETSAPPPEKNPGSAPGL